MKNWKDEDQSYVHGTDNPPEMGFEKKSGSKGGRGKGIDNPNMMRATDAEYSSAWKNRRSGSRSELKPDIRHA